MNNNKKYYLISTDSYIMLKPYEIEILKKYSLEKPCFLIKIKPPLYIDSMELKMEYALIMPRFKGDDLFDDTYPKYLHLCKINDESLLNDDIIHIIIDKEHFSIIDWVAMYDDYEVAKKSV